MSRIKGLLSRIMEASSRPGPAAVSRGGHGNPTAIFGPDAEIPYPDGTAMLDYELEVAAIIGADGEIGGFTIMNDWSARDIQRQEMRSASARPRVRTSQPASARSW